MEYGVGKARCLVSLCIAFHHVMFVHNWQVSELENDAGARITNTLLRGAQVDKSGEKKGLPYTNIIISYTKCTYIHTALLPFRSWYICFHYFCVFFGFSIFYPSLYRSYVYYTKINDMQQTIELVWLFDRDRMK